MSRETKFRSWNGKSIQYSNEYSSLGAFFECTDDLGYYDTSTVYQQFTGLLDNDGKEIYEGDLLKNAWLTNDPPRKVIFESGAFVVDGIGTLFDRTTLIEPSVVDDYVVIGNAFENPELLDNHA